MGTQKCKAERGPGPRPPAPPGPAPRGRLGLVVETERQQQNHRSSRRGRPPRSTLAAPTAQTSLFLSPFPSPPPSSLAPPLKMRGECLFLFYFIFFLECNILPLVIRSSGFCSRGQGGGSVLHLSSLIINTVLSRRGGRGGAPGPGDLSLPGPLAAPPAGLQSGPVVTVLSGPLSAHRAE